MRGNKPKLALRWKWRERDKYGHVWQEFKTSLSYVPPFSDCFIVAESNRWNQIKCMTEKEKIPFLGSLQELFLWIKSEVDFTQMLYNTFQKAWQQLESATVVITYLLVLSGLCWPRCYCLLLHKPGSLFSLLPPNHVIPVSIWPDWLIHMLVKLYSQKEGNKKSHMMQSRRLCARLCVKSFWCFSQGGKAVAYSKNALDNGAAQNPFSASEINWWLRKRV